MHAVRVALVLVTLSLGTAFAQDKQLSAGEIKTLIIGKNLQFATDTRGVTTLMKLNADGTGTGAYTSSRGTLNAATNWRVTDAGELCTHVQSPGFSENCTQVFAKPDGVFARVKDGKEQSTFKFQ